MIRPVLGGAEDAITKAMKGLDERFWRAGLMPPELEVRLICVDVRKEAGQLVYRCGGRELTDATAVTKWLVEQQAKQDGARVHVLLRGGPAGWAHQVLWVRCAAANLFLLAETEEDRLPFVTPGEAPASGEVFRLKITDEGGLRGPEGETTLGEWGRVLEKAAKGIGSKGLVEHEVVVRVGTRTAWGQLELAFDVAAQAGYYRLFVECPEGDTWKRVPFRLPVTRMDYLGIALYVEAPRVRLPRDEVVPPLLTVLIRCTGGGTVASVGPPRRSLLPWFGDDKPPAPIDSPEFRTRVEGLRGIERRRDHLGIAVAIDAPPDLPATAVLKVVALFNDAAGLHVMTCTPVVSAGRAELEARTLPVPAPAPGQEMDEER